MLFEAPLRIFVKSWVSHQKRIQADACPKIREYTQKRALSLQQVQFHDKMVAGSLDNGAMTIDRRIPNNRYTLPSSYENKFRMTHLP